MKRFPKNLLFYRLFISIFSILFFSIAFSIENEKFILERFYIIFPILLIIRIIYNVLSYLNYYYELNDNELIVYSGIFFKSKKYLQYSKIHAVDIKQGLIQKIFRIKALTLDSGSTSTGLKVEVAIYEKEEVIDNLEKIIKNKMNSNNDNNDNDVNNKNKPYNLNTDKKDLNLNNDIYYKFSKKEKIKNILLIPIFLAFILIFGILIIFLLSFLIQTLSSNILKIMLFVLLGYLILSVFGSIVFGIIISLNFYNYQVILRKDGIEISYGLFTKVKNILKYNRIKAIKVEQSLLKRILKISSIKLELVGYGESADGNNSSSNYLIPICKKEKVSEYIKKLNLEYQDDDKMDESPKKAFKYYIILPYLIITIIFLIFIPGIILIPYNKIIYIYLIFYLITLLITFFIRYLAYKQSGIYYDDKKIICFTGSLIKKRIIILKNNVIGIEKKSTYFRNKSHLNTLIIHFFNNSLNNVVKINLLNDYHYDKLLEFMKY